jgi:hypothetical protein
MERVVGVADLYTDPLGQITFQDVLEWLQSSPGESERLDFKKGYSDTVLASIVGMANHDGGLIILGVDEEQRSTGKTKRPKLPPAEVDLGKYEDWLTSRCFEDIRPTYRPAAQGIPGSAEDKGVVLIRVDPVSAPRPLWHRQKGVLWRIGDHNRPADLDTLRRLFQEEAGGLPDGVQAQFDMNRSHIAGANTDGCWLGVAALLPWPATAFDTAAKRLLLQAIERRFGWERASAEVQSAHDLLQVSRPRRRDAGWRPRARLAFYADGRWVYQARTEDNPVRLQWMLDRLDRWGSLFGDDDSVKHIFPGQTGVRVQLSLSGWPSLGVTPEGRFSAPLLASQPSVEGHHVARLFVLGQRDRQHFLETAVRPFVDAVLADAGYWDYERPLEATLKHPSLAPVMEPLD